MEYIGLIITFIILSVVLLLALINPGLGNKIKFLLILVVIWYGLVLYYVPRNLMGWPTEGEPPKSIIISTYIIEPSLITSGGIYFWVIKWGKERQSLSPEEFSKFVSEEPRCYKVPYSRDLHKALLEAQAEAARSGKYLGYRKGRERKEQDDEARFELIDPRELLPKEGEGAREVIPDEQRKDI